VKQDSEIAPRIRQRTDQPQFSRLRRGGRRVNEFLNRKFSDLCELCLCLKVFAACVNFPIYEASRIRIFLPPRREERQVRINIISLSLRPLRRRSGHALRLCGKYPDSFGCGAAACASAVNTSQSRVSRITEFRSSVFVSLNDLT
jgi:hypothetical protein